MKQRLSRLWRPSVGIALSLVLAFSLFATAPSGAHALTETQIQSILSLLSSFGADQTTITSVNAALRGQPTGGGTATTTVNVPSSFRFNQNLSQGSRGTEVLYLQRILNAYPTSRLALSGPGSPGAETTYFGPITRNAAVRFQEMFASEVLTPVGLTQGTGFVGPSTRAKLNSLIAAGFPGTPGGDGGDGDGGGNGGQQPATTTLSVAAGAQPSAALAPESAARVPFTRFTLSANQSGSVTVNNVTIEKTGFANNAVFDGVVLLDENGVQIGTARTLNSQNRATIGSTITIPAGSSRTFTIAGNMSSNLDSFAGQLAALSLVSVNTASGISTSGSLPITGAQHTINATLDIGDATVRTGSLGNTSVEREIGTTNHTFSSFILNAGSQENVRLRSIRWNQNGSASQNDLSDVVTVVGGTAYPTTVSEGGRFYTTVFPSGGISINQGQSVEVSARGDIDRGSGRTIVFDIDRASDIDIVGTQFNYGIIPTAQNTAAASNSTAQFTTGTPFFDGAVVTISGAAVTVTRSTATPAQNVAIQIPNQTLGGFAVEVQGEGVNIQNTVFDVSITRSSGSSAAVSDITNVTLVRSDTGSVVAGPVDGSGSGTTGTITFNDSVSLPQGTTNLILKGQLNTDFQDDDRITVSLEPSTDLSSIRGDTSGNTVNASPATTVSANPVTVGDESAGVSLGTTPVAQTVVAGATDFPVARVQFNLSGSTEDIRINSIPMTITHNGSPEILSNCRAYHVTGGANTLLTSGTNAVNPSSSLASGGTVTFTLDSGVVLEQGDVETIEIRCGISSSASSGDTFSFGINAAPTAFGVQSSRTVTLNVTTSTGATMTLATSGGFTVTQAPSSPSFTVVAEGQTQPVNILRFRATNEAVALNQLGLELKGTTSPSDLTSVTLWDGSQQVGSAVFTGTSRFATSTLSQSFTIPQFGERDLTIRATFSQIGTGQPGTQGADIAIDYDGDNASTTRGVGVASGSVITSTTNTDTNSAGVRLYNTFPTIALDSNPNTTLVNGTQTLMRFRVTANDSSALGIGKLTFDLSTTSANVTSVNAFVFTDAGYSSPASGVGANGQFDSANAAPDANGVVELYAENTGGTASPLQVPAGQTRYIEVRGTVTGSSSGSAVTTTLEGDSAVPALATSMGTLSEVDGVAQDDFIWSPNETTTSAVGDSDWTNGFGVPGLPANGLTRTLAR